MMIIIIVIIAMVIPGKIIMMIQPAKTRSKPSFIFIFFLEIFAIATPFSRWMPVFSSGWMDGTIYRIRIIIAGEMRQVDVGGHPVLLCRDQGDLKVNIFETLTIKV